MPPRPASDSMRHPAKTVPGSMGDRYTYARRARAAAPRLNDRRRRRWLRLADRLRHRGLSRLRARGCDDLRAEPEPSRHLPAVRVQPRPDRPALRVRVALPARRLAHLRAARRLVAPASRAAPAF